MVMLDWEFQNRKVTSTKAWLRDLMLIRWLLWMMPLLEPKEMACVTGFDENRCYKLLRELMAKKLAIRQAMGRHKGKRFRYWLTTRGARLVADETGMEVPWQVTERGIAWLVRRLPIVEAFYDLAPNLLRHEGVKLSPVVALTTEPDGSGDTAEFTPDLKICDFRWIEKGEIHAVVVYENRAWFPLVWVGTMVSESELKRDGTLAVEQLADRGLEPAGWVVVGSDHLAARLAAEFWPVDNVLAASTDGRVEWEMRPEPFTLPLSEKATSARLGRPENLVNWWNKDSKQYKPEMGALDSPMHYQIFRFVAEWCGPTPAHLERRFGESYRAAVRELRKAGLVAKIGGAFYLHSLGELTVAHMDRVSPQSVKGRLDVYLKKDGVYRNQQQRHNRSLLDVVQKLSDQGVYAYAGWRVRRTARDGTQVVPDAAVYLKRRDELSIIAFMELEFTARTPLRIERKRGPYLTVQWDRMEPIPSLWLLADAEMEERYRRHGLPSEPILTAVLDDFLKSGSSYSEPNWRNGDDWVPIYEVADMAVETYHAYLWDE